MSPGLAPLVPTRRVASTRSGGAVSEAATPREAGGGDGATLNKADATAAAVRRGASVGGLLLRERLRRYGEAVGGAAGQTPQRPPPRASQLSTVCQTGAALPTSKQGGQAPATQVEQKPERR